MRFIRIVFIAYILILLVSCTAENMIVHNAEVKSRAAYLPVHISKPGDSSRIDASFGVSYNKNKYFQLIPNERLEKGEISIINTVLDLNVDYKIDNKVAIFTSINGGLTEGKLLLGSMLGIGQIVKYNDFAIRYDLGLGFDFRNINADFSYDFDGWVFGGSGRKTDSMRGNSFAWNYFGAITFNTLWHADYPNLFLRVAYMNQSLFKVSVWDKLAYESEGIRNHNLIVSTGASLDLSPTFYLVIGLNYNYTIANHYAYSQHNILPFIRINYCFNVKDRSI